MDWNDLRLFGHLARHGGLGAAARAAGVSTATLGRRVQALETALGRHLVERRPDGYRLTAEGRALAEGAAAMESAALAIERWRDLGAAGRVVRISAGNWTSRFLARNVAALWTRADPFRLRFLPGEARLDIGRRAADIGLRNHAPDAAWLAGRRLGLERFAVYARAEPPVPDGFVAVTELSTPSAAWLRAEHGAEVVIDSSGPRLVLDLVRAGAGRAVLPMFVGEAETDLARIGPPIEALDHQVWMVLHHEDRHDPAIRTVADRIARLVRARQRAFAGRARTTGS